MSIANILKGVEDGLSKYSSLSRVALVYAVREDDPVMVFDPQNILRGHEPRLKEIFYDDYDQWKANIQDKIAGQPHDYIVPEEEPALAGLISWGGSCCDFFHQVWFTDHHPDMCSIQPTKRWLEQAACLLVNDVASQTPVINSSDYVLKNYALQAIADYIIDQRESYFGFDSKILIPSVLNDILKISQVREEGKWARGMLFFIDPQRLTEIPFLTQILKDERPVITDIKHIRKLLVAVENSSRKLVSDGCTIIGVTDCDIPDYAVTADFRGDHGFLKLGEKKIASFFDGSFHSTTREAKMVELEEILLDLLPDPKQAAAMFQVVSSLVHGVSKKRHGCTMVIDLNPTPVSLSGHVLDPPLSLLEEKNRWFAGALLRIDGAVHISSEFNIHGFGCLLDGRTVNWEDRARGARYNSALRFSADHNRVIVVVVSADRPVSIIYNGIELNAYILWRPVYQLTPEPVTLNKYINGVIP